MLFKHSDYRAAFMLGVLLNSGFVVVEAAFGIFSDSVALLADAGHNLSDVLGLVLAWGAVYLTQREATERRTYGWRKSSVLAALFNAVILLLVVGGIGWESIRRLSHPPAVAGKTMIWVAAIGVAINTLTAFLFMSGRKKDLNIRGAFVHMAADAGVSAGVVLAGAGILATGWERLDPVISIVIVLIILAGTWGLLRDSFNLALDAVPRHIDAGRVRERLSGFPGVLSVHDLHIWGMSTTEAALTAHVVKQDYRNGDALIQDIEKGLKEEFGIGHVTIQWEGESSGGDSTPGWEAGGKGRP